MTVKALNDTNQVLAAIVERSQPRSKPIEPVVEAEVEKILRDIDIRSAQCYADIELKIHRFQKLAAAIDASDGAPQIELAEEDSLVHHLEDFRFQVEKSKQIEKK